MGSRRRAAGDLTRRDFMMFGPGTGRRKDPEQGDNIAGRSPDVVDRTFRDYALKVTGGPLPNYEL